MKRENNQLRKQNKNYQISLNTYKHFINTDRKNDSGRKSIIAKDKRSVELVKLIVLAIM